MEQVPPHSEPSRPDDTCLVVLLDTGHLSESMMQAWQRSLDEVEGIMLAAINISDEDRALELLMTLNFQGIFYRGDALAMYCMGLETLLRGRLWMSRPLMSRLLQLLRWQQRNSLRSVCGLTHREMEIISLLGAGASNPKIAEQLFVSEHTVKSHLYNIFRKIKVHNRVQAANWARHNLGVSPGAVGGRQPATPAVE